MKQPFSFVFGTLRQRRTSGVPDGLQMQLLPRRNLEMLLILQQEVKELMCYSVFHSLAKCVMIKHVISEHSAA